MSAGAAWDEFGRTVQRKQVPADVPDIQASTLLDAVVIIRGGSSAEARRLMSAGGVSIDGNKTPADIPVVAGNLIKVGKRDYGRIP